MRIAVEGCCHGELDRIYASIKHLERVEGFTVDLLLVCGDFQSIRNLDDLGVMACPDKFRHIGGFYKYYTGEKKAPVPTIFIGGNHEASSYLWELYHGGWVAPNIYFLGFAGMIQVGRGPHGLRIGGLSGIYKKQDYDHGYYETQPFNESHSRSIYHVRKYNVYRTAQIQRPVDVMLSHDWPRGIAFSGNTRQLLQMKPFLGGEINTNTLGSYPNEFLLKKLKPTFWFSAHLHVKFAAIYRHDTNQKAQTESGVQEEKDAIKVENPDEIDISSDADEDEANHENSGPKEQPQRTGDGNETENDANGISDEGGAHPEASDAELSFVIDTTPAAAVPARTEPVIPHDNADLEMPKSAPDSVATATQDVPSVATASEMNDTAETAFSSTSPSSDHPKRHAAYTKFLSLDKCLPNKDFLQIIDVPDAYSDSTSEELEFFYDEEWLAIVRATYDLFSLEGTQKQLPPEDEIKKRIAEEIEWVKANVPDLQIPTDFVTTGPWHPWHANASASGNRDRSSRDRRRVKPGVYSNPQTERFCEMLQLENVINVGGLPPWAPPPPPVPRSQEGATEGEGENGAHSEADPTEETAQSDTAGDMVDAAAIEPTEGTTARSVEDEPLEDDTVLDSDREEEVEHHDDERESIGTEEDDQKPVTVETATSAYGTESWENSETHA
ncbi:hypothetical protein HDU85_003075 [Gaertneriomyces sp. JEL0708]|nr:hypothetical protein HDU85_003075 [Gaertneriomyces sp. JEL0708]